MLDIKKQQQNLSQLLQGWLDYAGHDVFKQAVRKSGVRMYARFPEHRGHRLRLHWLADLFEACTAGEGHSLGKCK